MHISTAALAALSLAWTTWAGRNYSSIDMMRAQLSLMDDRPDNCPPCFNCLLPAFTCGQFSDCNKFNGKCSCPPGYGGDDCLQPVCGSLADGNDRPMRDGDYCECDEGWSGINCNVCKTNQACNKLMPENTGGVCYQNGDVINENYQMCDVTNVKIVEILDGKRPQVTFSCNAGDKTCDFQFWVEHRESFYCALDKCQSAAENTNDQNSTNYKCEDIKCQCIPDRMLCGENGSVDISDFLTEEIKGPATFECLQQHGGTNKCKFQEPAMNQLIQQIFSDSSIQLDCRSGECLYESQVPGYERPVKKINTPLIAGVIAACSLFVVGVILTVYYLSRRQFKHGPIYLDDSDDESTRLMTDHKPASLYFENVSYNLSGKQILSDVQGVAHPGEIMAIMGASGAGKTTFLDILARKNKRGAVAGSFYVNGEKVSDTDYKSVVGFVDQEDTMLPTLTVHETILTSALLRLPRDMGRAAKEQRVYEVEKQLGISHIKDSLIGSEEGKGRGISGGEKRRVGIACELVTSPSILFLDEPTSGLDAYNAFNVIECLVTLAKTYKRTVIFTIHQPRSNIVALFDRLLLLAKGRTVFSGRFENCQEYFDKIGYSCPPGFNIADYLVDLTMHAGSSPAVEGLLDDASSFSPSSTRAVKSIASVSGRSIDESLSNSPGDSLRRPGHSRKDSVRTRQERELYTRRKNGADTPVSQPDETPLDPNARSTDQWLRLSKQQAHARQRSLEDADNLPPSADGNSDLDHLVRSYAKSDVASGVREDIHNAVDNAQTANGSANGHAQENGTANGGTMGRGYARVSYARQFIILSQRTWRNLYRNPLLMLTHYAIAILLAVLSGYLFYGLTSDIPGFQNRLGLFFFILALFGFSTLSSLSVFGQERLLFVRERANGYYAPITYFAAKIIFDIVPLRIIPPIIMGAIIYPMTGLEADGEHFFKFLLILILFNLAAAGICLFIGIVCKEHAVANLIGSLVMLFSLLFAGLLLNHDKIPKSMLWLQTLSIFHYGFEALIVNEVAYKTLVDKKYGLDITVPGGTILSTFGFDTQALWPDVISLAVFAASFIVLAYLAMHVLLVEKR